jgi:hypothetical protein
MTFEKIMKLLYIAIQEARKHDDRILAESGEYLGIPSELRIRMRPKVEND